MPSGRLPLLVPDELDAAQRPVYDAIAGGRRAAGPQRFRLRREDGSLTGPFNALLYAPAVGARVGALGEAVRFETSFTDREREVAILTVAAARKSAYERYAHEPLGRAAGLGDDELAGIRRGSATFDDPKERTIYAVAAALADGNSLDDDAYAEAVAHLGEPALVELCVLVGYYGMLATILDTFAVGVPEQTA